MDVASLQDKDVDGIFCIMERAATVLVELSPLGLQLLEKSIIISVHRTIVVSHQNIPEKNKINRGFRVYLFQKFDSKHRFVTKLRFKTWN